MSTPENADFLDLNDYRRRVREMYTEARRFDLHPQDRWSRYRRARDELFSEHPQSALSDEQRRRFSPLRYFDYDPELAFLLPVDTDVVPEVIQVDLETDGPTRMRAFGRIHFVIGGQPAALTLYWIMGYGGGIFLPFRDATRSEETYGGGRYLLDTIKGADLGRVGDRLVIDFNFAYNPSCAYHPRWHCPLAPPKNWLDIPIRAGEMLPPWDPLEA